MGLNENIQSIIKNKGLKHSFVAEKLGMSASAFSYRLNSSSTIKSEDVLKLCKALDVTPNELFGYESA